MGQTLHLALNTSVLSIHQCFQCTSSSSPFDDSTLKFKISLQCPYWSSLPNTWAHQQLTVLHSNRYWTVIPISLKKQEYYCNLTQIYFLILFLYTLSNWWRTILYNSFSNSPSTYNNCGNFHSFLHWFTPPYFHLTSIKVWNNHGDKRDLDTLTHLSCISDKHYFHYKSSKQHSEVFNT